MEHHMEIEARVRGNVGCKRTQIQLAVRIEGATSLFIIFPWYGKSSPVWGDQPKSTENFCFRLKGLIILVVWIGVEMVEF